MKKFIKRRISKNLFISFIIQGFYTILSPLSMILLARVLGPDEFGVFAFTISIVTILSIISELGLPTVITRFGTIYFMKNKMELYKGLLKFSNSRILFGSFLLVSIVLILYFFDLINEEYGLTLVVGLPLIFLFALSRVRSSILTSINKVNLAQLPEMIVRPILLIFFVLLIYYYGKISAFNSVLIYVFINAVVYLFGQSLVDRNTRKFKLKRIISAFEKNKWTQVAFPLFLLGGIQILGAQSDVFLLGLLSDSNDIGVFKSMYQISLLVIFSLSAINAICTPLIVENFEKNRYKELKKLLVNFCGINFILAILIGFPFFFFGEFFIELIYGEEYIIGYKCLQILIIGRIINTTFGVSNQFLKMIGEEKQATKGILLGVILAILLNVILIPTYGIIGAAIASSIALITWNVYLFLLLRKKLNHYNKIV